MTTVIVDYGSGNLHSARKAFQRMAAETDAGGVCVSSDPDIVTEASRIVLPGVGAFADCLAGLKRKPGLLEAVDEAAKARCVPFLGICVGMQLLANVGREHGNAAGLGWIPGTVDRIAPDDPELKIPHMGWNELALDAEHWLFRELPRHAHAYFVHSYHFLPDDLGNRIAHAEHGCEVTAAIGLGNIAGVQFHPEKSQGTGLRIIRNFLEWNP